MNPGSGSLVGPPPLGGGGGAGLASNSAMNPGSGRTASAWAGAGTAAAARRARAFDAAPGPSPPGRRAGLAPISTASLMAASAPPDEDGLGRLSRALGPSAGSSAVSAADAFEGGSSLVPSASAASLAFLSSR